MDTTTKRSEGSCGYVAYDGNVREHDDEEQSWAFFRIFWGSFAVFLDSWGFLGIRGDTWRFFDFLGFSRFLWYGFLGILEDL